MRTELVVVAVLAAGGATAVGVSACGSSASKDKSTSGTAATTGATVAPKPAPPATLTVRVAGKLTKLKVTDISFAYCRKHPRSCAAVSPTQQRQLTPNQRKAIKAAVAKVRAQDAASQPAPQVEPEPEPQPAPEPQPQGGGETTTE